MAGYLVNPHRYNDWAFCSKCDGFVPHRECRWAETNEPLDAYFGRLKAAVPAPPASRWLAYAAAPVAGRGRGRASATPSAAGMDCGSGCSPASAWDCSC